MAGPPAKRPNKDPMPSHRPTPEQYAAMMAAAAAAGQPLPRHHVSYIFIFFFFFILNRIHFQQSTETIQCKIYNLVFLIGLYYGSSLNPRHA